VALCPATVKCSLIYRLSSCRLLHNIPLGARSQLSKDSPITSVLGPLVSELRETRPAAITVLLVGDLDESFGVQLESLGVRIRRSLCIETDAGCHVELREWCKERGLTVYSDVRRVTTSEIARVLDGGPIDLVVARNGPTDGMSGPMDGTNGIGTEEERRGLAAEDAAEGGVGEELSGLFIELNRILSNIEQLQIRINDA
jgi:hypothetical protein